MAMKEKNKKLPARKATGPEGREKVMLFGEEVDGGKHEHDGNVVFGVIILLVGIVFLFNSLGLLSWNVWEVLGQYWPVLLILWGIQIVLGRNPLSRVVILILSFVTIATLFIYVLKDQTPFISYIPGKFIEWSKYWEVIGK